MCWYQMRSQCSSGGVYSYFYMSFLLSLSLCKCVCYYFDSNSQLASQVVADTVVSLYIHSWLVFCGAYSETVYQKTHKATPRIRSVKQNKKKKSENLSRQINHPKQNDNLEIKQPNNLCNQKVFTQRKNKKIKSI